MATTNHRTLPVALLATVALALLAACGSEGEAESATTTTEPLEEGVADLSEGPLVLTGIEAAQHGEWMEAMSTMCVENFERLPELPDEVTPVAVGEFLVGAVEMFEDRVDGIVEIGPPLISEAAYRDYRQHTEDVAQMLVEAADIAERGDEGALLELTAEIEASGAEANLSALDLGLEGCVMESGEDGLPFQQGPVTLGDDPYLDGLWHACFQGEGGRCDELREQAPAGTVYAEFAMTCGGRYSLNRVPLQCDANPENADAPESYGDDQDLDELWDACEAGDGVACDELYFDAAADTDYARFGSSCGGRFDPDEVPLTCEVIDDDD